MKTPRLVPLTVLLAVVAFVPVAHGQLLPSTNDNKVIVVKGGPAAIRTADK